MRYVAWIERDVIPTATGDFVIGGEAVARRYRAEELIELPLDTLVAHRRARARAGAGATSARPLIGSRPAAIRRRCGRRCGAPTRSVGRSRWRPQAIVDSLTAFVRAKGLVTVPTGERVVVAPAQPFDLGFASMHASPPLEKTPVQSFYYITDASADQTAEQQEAWLERFNYASLTNTSAHEAMPGHWLHSQYMRKTPGKVRRIWIGLNPFPQPSSGQDGWAHYAEQLVVEQGYGNGDPRYQLAQLSDALTRICRLLSGIKVHSARVDAGPGAGVLRARRLCGRSGGASAKRSARRTTRPTAATSSGSVALLTLRRDLQAKLGAAFNLREFHERVHDQRHRPHLGAPAAAAAGRYPTRSSNSDARYMRQGEKVRVGVLGAGAWARFAHLPGYKRDPRCELVAIADPVVERAQEFAAEFGIPHVYDSHEALIAPRRHRPGGRLHAQCHALRAERGRRSRRASTCCARSRWPTTTATRVAPRRWRESKGLKTKLGFTFRYSPGHALHEGADRRGLHRHAVHLQRLRAELAVARPAEPAAAGRSRGRPVGDPGVVAGGLRRADHRHRAPVHGQPVRSRWSAR